MIKFIFSVSKRLLALTSNSAYLIAESEAAKKQAQSANRAATSLLEEIKKETTEVNLIIITNYLILNLF